jgi:hypothetical protein
VTLPLTQATVAQQDGFKQTVAIMQPALGDGDAMAFPPRLSVIVWDRLLHNLRYSLALSKNLAQMKKTFYR